MLGSKCYKFNSERARLVNWQFCYWTIKQNTHGQVQLENLSQGNDNVGVKSTFYGNLYFVHRRNNMTGLFIIAVKCNCE
jgi:hypothetical protein